MSLKAAEWISLVQLVVVSGTLFYTARRVQVATEGVRVAAEASRAATLERLSVTSRELQLRTIDDKDLAPLLLKQSKLTPDRKLAIFMAIIFNHYALVFDLHELDQIPKPVWDAFVADMAEFYRDPIVQARWNEVKSQHRTQFREFISTQILRHTTGP